RVTSRPPSSTRPPSGRSNPAISRSSVVFPDPDGPSSVKNSPERTVRSVSASATTSPYRFLSPATWTAADAAARSPEAAGCAGPGTVIIRFVVHDSRRATQWHGPPHGSRLDLDVTGGEFAVIRGQCPQTGMNPQPREAGREPAILVALVL